MVACVEAWLAMGQEERAGEAPLFPKEDGGEMSEDTPRGRLHVWLRRVGELDEYVFGFHSLRAGAATAAAKAGVPERLLKLHGNWASDAVRVYIRPDVAERTRVSAALGR